MVRRRRGNRGRSKVQVHGSDRQPSRRTEASDDHGAAPRRPEETPNQPMRRVARTCGWCGGPIAVKATGRLPKWCSPSCRQRAWEQSRAAASGLSAVRIVERRVEIPTPASPSRRDWPRLLGDLACQLEDGRVYDRDLNALSIALTAVLDAHSRRSYVRRAAYRGER